MYTYIQDVYSCRHHVQVISRARVINGIAPKPPEPVCIECRGKMVCIDLARIDESSTPLPRMSIWKKNNPKYEKW